MANQTSVVVVGGTSGIGEASARRFAAAGARVTISGRDRARLDAALERLPGVRGMVADGAQRESVERLFGDVGAFDHLVLALSGGKGGGPFRQLMLDHLRSGFEAKLFAQLTTLQAALPHVRASVTFVSAASARSALPGTAGLAAINGAIESMVGPLAAELGPLRINAISPGVVDTPWWDKMPPDVRDSAFEKARRSSPLGRVGEADDVARAVVAIAENPFITGSVLAVDGGIHLARG